MDPSETVVDAHLEIVTIIEPLTRYVRAHAGQQADADDVVQEALTRVLDLGERLTPGTALAYGIVVARHLLIDRSREAQRARRLGHRVIDLTDSGRPVEPEAVLLRQEERTALELALAAVPEAERSALLAHVLDDVPVATIAEHDASNSAAVAARLARTRAKLRVDYVLALRGVQSPTARCRPVLLALSAADRRRQSILRAGNHLLTCAVCAELSEPVLRRRSALAAILPWLGLGPLLGLVRRLLRQASAHPATAAAGAGGAATAVTVALVMVLTPSKTPAPRPATEAPVLATAAPTAGPGQVIRVSDGELLLPVPPNLGSMDGERASARSVPVEAVAADEGFWIGAGPRTRVWVQLRTDGHESHARVRVGDTVSFSGTVQAHSSAFAGQVGISAGEGAGELTKDGAHLSVVAADLRVTRS